MVDPDYITDYNHDTYGLQEVLLFWVCAAGKNAKTSAAALDTMMDEAESWLSPKDQGSFNPFETLKFVGEGLVEMLKTHGIGCYNNKARTIRELIESNLDLKTCTRDDLLEIYGIGMKTASCFIMHSRKNARCAGLDTHILKYLRDEGYDVPTATPGSKRKYLEIEQKFLALADKSPKTVARFDLDIWKRYRNRTKNDKN